MRARLKFLLVHGPIGLLARATTRVSERRLARLLVAVVYGIVRRRSPESALRLLLLLDRDVRNLAEVHAARWGGGLHPKHRLTRYHDFFVQRLRPGERVLDIGSGYGALAYAMAERAGAHVTAIEIDPTAHRAARERFAHERIRWVLGDARRDVPDEPFDAIVISNTLEHIEDRVGLIRTVQARCRPARWLIRVPAFERDWLVPLKREMGIDERLDDTHFIEYREGELERELEQAGLVPTSVQRIWGELWCEARPAPGAP